MIVDEYVELVGYRPRDSNGVTLARSKSSEDVTEALWEERLDNMLKSGERFVAIHDAESFCTFQPEKFSHFRVRTTEYVM